MLTRSIDAGAICCEIVPATAPPLPRHRRLDLLDLPQMVIQVPAQELEPLVDIEWSEDEVGHDKRLWIEAVQCRAKRCQHSLTGFEFRDCPGERAIQARRH